MLRILALLLAGVQPLRAQEVAGAFDLSALARLALNQVTCPAVLRRLETPVTLPASVIEQAFIRDNEELDADKITITCSNNRIQEARICLTRALEPRECQADVIRDCTLDDALFDPVR